MRIVSPKREAPKPEYNPSPVISNPNPSMHNFHQMNNPDNFSTRALYSPMPNILNTNVKPYPSGPLSPSKASAK